MIPTMILPGLILGVIWWRNDLAPRGLLLAFCLLSILWAVLLAATIEISPANVIGGFLLALANLAVGAAPVAAPILRNKATV